MTTKTPAQDPANNNHLARILCPIHRMATPQATTALIVTIITFVATHYVIFGPEPARLISCATLFVLAAAAVYKLAYTPAKRRRGQGPRHITPQPELQTPKTPWIITLATTTLNSALLALILLMLTVFVDAKIL